MTNSSNKTLYKYAEKMIYESRYKTWGKDILDESIANQMQRRIECPLLKGPFKDEELITIKRYLELREDFKKISLIIDMIDSPVPIENSQITLQSIKEKGIKNYRYFAKILPEKYVSEIEKILQNIVNNTLVSIDQNKCNILVSIIKQGLKEEETFIQLYDEYGITPSFINSFISFYYQVICLNQDNIIRSLTTKEIVDLDSFNEKYKKYCNKPTSSNEIEIDIEQANEVIRLVTISESYLELKDDYYSLVEYLAQKGYTYRKINDLFSVLKKLWIIYINEDVKTNTEVERSNIKLKDRNKQISMFQKLVETYNYLCTSSYFINTICSSEPNRDSIIELSIKLKYLNNISPSDMKEDFNKEHIKKIDDKSKEKLEEYKKQYKKYFEDEKAKENQKNKEIKRVEEEKEATAFITQLIKDKPYSLIDYANSKDVSLHRIRSYIEIIKNSNPELYEYYTYFNKNNIKFEGDEIERKIGEIIYYINNGITENGETRPFDIVDYLGMIDIPLDILVKKYSNVAISAFYKKYKYDRKMSDAVLESTMKNEVCYIKKNKDGELLYEYRATEEDKRKAVDSLREKKIPITRCSYEDMLKRILFSKGKQKVIKPNK